MMIEGTYVLEERDGRTIITLTPAPQPAGSDVTPPISLLDVLPTYSQAAYPFETWDRDPAKIRYLTIHHSAGQRATQNIKWWHQHHTRNKSWSRVGYHFGIAALNPGDPIKLYQMNRIQTLSWHDARNTDTVGVCMAGDLRAGYDVEPDDVQLDLFGQLMAWLLPQLPGLKAMVGHKRWSSTACPGDIEKWAPLLIDAARGYGADIAGLLQVGTGAKVALQNAAALVLRPAQALGLRKHGLGDDEERGIGLP